jgi:hypothetical protein
VGGEDDIQPLLQIMNQLFLKNAAPKLARVTGARLIHFGILIGWTVMAHGEPLEIGIVEVGSGNDVEFTVTNNTDHGIFYTAKLLGGFHFRIGLPGVKNAWSAVAGGHR